MNEDQEIVEQEQPVQPANEAAQIREELAAMRNEVREAREDARHWREQAVRATPAPAAAVEEEEEPQLSEDLLEVVSSGDPKRVNAALKEMGFVRAKDVQKMIGATASEMVRRESIYTRFPEMRDPKSEFYAAADKEYKRIQSRFGTNSIEAIEEAAERVAERMGIEPDEPRRGRQSVEDEDPEARRVRRVGSQSAPRRQPGREDTKAEPTSAQKSIVAKLQSIGAPITMDGYVKRATKDGVNIAGVR